MRWLSFYRDSEDAKGPLAYKNATFGYVVRDGEAQEGVVDAGKRSQFETLKQAIEENALDTIVESCGQSPDFALGEITYAPTITQPNKILCIGLNYKAHQEETGRGGEGVPTVFARFAAAQIGHNQEMLRPKESGALDFEGEIVQTPLKVKFYKSWHIYSKPV